MKCKIAVTLLLVAFGFAKINVQAQNIQYNMFDAMPLVLNPAYTGMIDGKVRANAIYRNQWKSVTVPFVSFAVSFDGPVMTLRNGDYFGAGLLVMRDKAGDGTLQNFLGVGSVSYHKLLGSDSGWFKGRGCDLAFGLQGGYTNSMMDMSKVYFGDESLNNNFYVLPPPGGGYYLGMYNHVNYYVLNAGISFSQAVSKGFNYTIGFKAGNINQPNDALLKKQNDAAGLDTRYTTSAGANIAVAKRFALRPAVVYVSQTSASQFIAGNEFRYEVRAKRTATHVFCGVWYRTSDVAMVTAGINTGIVRVGLSFDYNVSTLNSASNGNGAFEMAIGFNSRRKTSRNRHVPCTRF